MNTRRAAAFAAGLVALVLWLPGPAVPPGGASAGVPAGGVQWQRRPVDAADLPGAVGVQLMLVAVSGDGGLLDLRYRVTDADKAAALHASSTPPAIVDEETGLVVSRLYMNHGHSGPLKPAVTYYLVFENPGGWVRRGRVVTVLLGAFQVEHVAVR